MVKIREGLDGLSLLSLIRGLTFLQPQTDFVFSTCPRPNCPRVRWAAAEGKKDGAWNFELCKTFCLSCCFPGGSDGKESACNAGNPDSISGSGRSLGERNGNPLQYCLENPMDTGAWWAIVHGFAELDTTEQLTLSLSLFFITLPGRDIILLPRSRFLRVSDAPTLVVSLPSLTHLRRRREGKEA